MNFRNEIKSRALTGLNITAPLAMSQSTRNAYLPGVLLGTVLSQSCN